MSPEFIIDEGVFIGINLGADFCAEHEQGIAGIRSTLGIPTDTMLPENQGIKGRTITKFNPASFFFEKGKTHSCLTFDQFGTPRGWKGRELDPKTSVLSTAWSEGDFGIVVENTHAEYLKDLFEAFKRLDVAIGLGMGGPFQNGGLNIIIASRFPKETNEIVKAADEDHRQMLLAAKATGIEDELKKAGIGYFALSPRWKDETKKEIVFWLNPREQRENNYGWFSVADLKLWIKGKGPIPKKSKKK
jgi:hypothetical protein